MLKLLLIFLGAGLGGVLRYGLSGLWAGSGFPVGTLVVNIAGCLGIGILGALLTGPVLVREEFRIALLVGVLGGFTTFSTFAHETLALSTGGQWRAAILNLVLSNGLGLLAVWAGIRLSQRFFGV